jgi:hypothetical protein
MAARQRNYFYGWELNRDRFLEGLRTSPLLRDVRDYIKNEYDSNRFYTGGFYNNNLENNNQLYRFIIENFNDGPEYGDWFPTVNVDDTEFRLYRVGSVLWFATVITASSLEAAREVLRNLPPITKQKISQFQNVYGTDNSTLDFRWLR